MGWFPCQGTSLFVCRIDLLNRCFASGLDPPRLTFRYFGGWHNTSCGDKLMLFVFFSTHIEVVSGR
jgi:hypothetical protein